LTHNEPIKLNIYDCIIYRRWIDATLYCPCILVLSKANQKGFANFHFESKSLAEKKTFIISSL